jgi:hypothetical protein
MRAVNERREAESEARSMEAITLLAAEWQALQKVSKELLSCSADVSAPE